MNRIYYCSETREFTDAETVRKHSANIANVLEHIIKLQLGFNRQFDLMHHRGAIAGWVIPIIEDIQKDKRGKGALSVFYLFLEKCDKQKLLKGWTNHFVKDYNFRGKLTEADFDSATSILKSIMLCKNKEEVYDVLESAFPNNN